MKAEMSIKNLCFALFLSCTISLASLNAVEIHKFRLAGEPIDISLQQEADYAALNALKWLRAQQNPDGSWGSSTSNVERTSIVLLALTGYRDKSESLAKAALWLDTTPPATNDTQAAAWRLIALLSSAATSTADNLDTLTTRLLQEAPLKQPPPTAPLSQQLIINTALILADPTAAKPAISAAMTDHLAALSAAPASLRTDPAPALWLAARTINIAGRSILVSNGEKMDWRRDIAQNLVNSQRRDPTSSGAFWSATTPDDSITATALALLTLREL